MRAGDPDDDSLANEYVGEDIPGGSTPTPDQNEVDEIGRAYGLQDEDNGSLRTSSEVLARRDRRRPELQPPARARAPVACGPLGRGSRAGAAVGLRRHPVPESLRHGHRPSRRARRGDGRGAQGRASILRADLHRAGGPRGAVDKAEADTEAERLIRGWLLGAFLGWGFLGEETGNVPAHPGEPMWLVDPNDGTRDYLKGRRGSAVSIALLVGQRAAARRRVRVRFPGRRGGPLRLGRGLRSAPPERPAGRAAPAGRPGAARRGARLQRRGLRPHGQPRLRDPGPLPRGAEHRPPPGARGGGRGRGGRLAELALGVGLRRGARPAARGRGDARRRAGPRGGLRRPTDGAAASAPSGAGRRWSAPCRHGRGTRSG